MGKCWLEDGADVQTAASVVCPGKAVWGASHSESEKTEPGCSRSITQKQQLNQMQRENGLKAGLAMRFLQKNQNTRSEATLYPNILSQSLF